MSNKDIEEVLDRNIKILWEELWREKIYSNQEIEEWLTNYNTDIDKIHAKFLLSKFTYFGHKEVYEMLKSLYRDKIKYPLVREIRKANKDTTNLQFINNEFKEKLNKVRFLGIGNPSESGIHLLYFFRQINKLSKNLFINGHEFLTDRESLHDIDEIIFIDDLCGSGSQASRYSKSIVCKLKEIKPNLKISYYVLIATKLGIGNIIDKDLGFDNVSAVFTLDNSFKCFHNDSRYYKNCNNEITAKKGISLCEKYSASMTYSNIKEPIIPTGYGDSQMLLSFFHNTPNNTLPIFWFEDENHNWYPLFKRYPKIYSMK